MGRLKIYFIGKGNASLTVSTMVDAANKFCNLLFFAFAELLEMNFGGNLRSSNCDEDYYHNQLTIILPH